MGSSPLGFELTDTGEQGAAGMATLLTLSLTQYHHCLELLILAGPSAFPITCMPCLLSCQKDPALWELIRVARCTPF